jgi:hypothetical protein
MSRMTIRLSSYVLLEQGVDDLGPDAPSSVLSANLRAEGIPFECVTSRLEREAAAVDPDTADFYPNGPDSGPAWVTLLEFLTSQEHWEQACGLLGAAEPD